TWLTTIQGVPLGTAMATGTAVLLVTIARQQQQGWHGPAAVIKPKAPTPREQRLAVLAALPGVGPVPAARLLHHFGSPRGVPAAPEPGRATVRDVGEELGGADRGAAALSPARTAPSKPALARASCFLRPRTSRRSASLRRTSQRPRGSLAIL